MSSRSQDPLDDLIPFDEAVAKPTTPLPANAAIGESSIEKTAAHLTPPSSTQIPASNRSKDRTPTPTYSSISTPPPTVGGSHQDKISAVYAATMSSEQIQASTAEDLGAAITNLQAAYQEAKMSAAHYKLQYQMLVQESSAAIERMVVEARIEQYDNDIIHNAEQAKAAVPSQVMSLREGMIPVQKDLYQGMCSEIQHLTKLASYLHSENKRQEKTIIDQESEIESLTDRVSMMRERIRANRDHVNHYRKQSISNEYMPRNIYGTPHARHGQDQFAALLQASEMASQEASPRAIKKAKAAVTMTPQRYNKHVYTTPSRQVPNSMPATAPMPRTDVFKPAVYAQPQKSSGPAKIHPAPRSEETVSNSDRDVDSEAETEIIDATGEINESQASRAASFLLRPNQEPSFTARPPVMKQTRLFGAVRKPGVERDEDGRPSKRARTGNVVGLGIDVRSS